MIDLYCERTAPGFWNEPLNTVTNIAFLIAGASLLQYARRSGRLTLSVATLVLLCAAIGVGSFLFHTLATGWAEWADTLPILLFQLVYLTVYGRDVAALSRTGTVILLAGFFGATWVSGMRPELFNGSIAYLPAILFITGLGIFHAATRKQARWLLLTAAGIFLLSLAFRSIDRLVCDLVPRGTHSLWHLLNGVVLYLTGRAYMANLTPPLPMSGGRLPADRNR